MKKLIFLFVLICIMFSCKQDTDAKTSSSESQENEVLVLGTIHSGHLKYEEYDLEVLRILIKKINPDYILAEIPPDRFKTAEDEFKASNTITETRVSRFPEYVDVIFPLTKEMDFEIIPTAGWTKEMSDARNKKLKEISKDSNRVEEWSQLTKAGEKSDSLIQATGHAHDPFWINTNEYDELVEIELSVYNKLFNDELGLGGWDNINEAHYLHISNALDEHSLQGKRFLITYGAGHKGWFLRALNKRKDIKLISLKEAIQ